jgi:hypothetical protein
MDIDENDYDSSNHVADDDDVSIPVARLLPALRAYYNAHCNGDDVPEDDLLTLCQDYQHCVSSLAHALHGAFGVAFEYEHLLESTATVSSSAVKNVIDDDPRLQARSAIDEDPRLRHPLCPPS